MNASGSLSAKPWALHLDTDKYPLLHASERTSNFSKLNRLINSITLKLDTIAEVKHFYEGINKAIMTILQAHLFLLDYKYLKQDFDHFRSRAARLEPGTQYRGILVKGREDPNIGAGTVVH